MIYKILSFKSVPQEILTYYLDREELKESWRKVIEAMPFESKTNGKVADMGKELEELRTVMRVLAKYVSLLKQTVAYKRSAKGFIEEVEEDKIIKKFLEEKE